MTSPLVLILYNQPLLPESHPDADSEHAIVDVAKYMSATLSEYEFRTQMLALGPDPAKLWAALQEIHPDVVFNLYEGTHDNPETESYVAGILEWSGIAFTGSPALTLSLARAKDLVKAILKHAKIPAAKYLVVWGRPLPENTLGWPVIVKPARQDASVGVDQESVCTSADAMNRRIEYILETYGPPVLVEEYIAGREFNVAILELPTLEYLPPAEIVFPPEEPGKWGIVTYSGKWIPGTPDYETTPPKYPAEVSKAVARKLGQNAIKAFRALECRDYARIDFRMTAEGKIYLLEVNPNPEISESAGFAGCLGSAKISHKEMVVRLIRQALTRKNRARPTFQPAPRPAPTLPPSQPPTLPGSS